MGENRLLADHLHDIVPPRSWPAVTVVRLSSGRKVPKSVATGRFYGRGSTGLVESVHVGVIGADKNHPIGYRR
jgi:hypothetical protein